MIDETEDGMPQVVFATDSVQFTTYCDWKGLEPGKDAFPIYSYQDAGSHARDLVARGIKDLREEDLVLLPNATGMTKSVQKLLLRPI
jgi:hypothetical protein